MKHLNAKILFFAGIILGFILPQAGGILHKILIPVLIVMMTVSIKDIAFKHISKKDTKTIGLLLAMNYIVLTFSYILLTYFFIENPLYRNALFVLGIMPPAIGIIALSYLLHGNTGLGFVAEFIGYLSALILIPLFSFFLFEGGVSLMKILEVLITIIIIPYVLSRIIFHIEKKRPFLSAEATHWIINAAYGITFYIVVAANRETILQNFWSLIPVLIVLLLTKFGLAAVIYISLEKKMVKSLDVLFMLFGTLKNGGAAIAITTVLFGIEATVPFAIDGIILPFYIIFLEWLVLRKGDKKLIRLLHNKRHTLMPFSLFKSLGK